MPQEFVVTVTSVDRVGIVSGLSEALLELGGNIDALSQTVMRGYFTLIVTVRFDEERERQEIADAIRRKGPEGELGVLVKERDTSAGEKPVVKDA